MGNLHQTLLKAATEPIRGETSDAQKNRVKGFVEAEKARKRVMKDRQKATKASRRGEY
jgi:hypothetical protein